MSNATYRGVKYNTDQPVQESRTWKNIVIQEHHDKFTYRGKKYTWKGGKDVWVGLNPTPASSTEKGKGDE